MSTDRPFADDSDDELATMLAEYRAELIRSNNATHRAIVLDDIAVVEAEQQHRARAILAAPGWSVVMLPGRWYTGDAVSRIGPPSPALRLVLDEA